MADNIIVRTAEMKDAEILVIANMEMAWETERKRLDPAVVTRGVHAVLGNPAYGFYVIASSNGTVAGSLMVTFEWSDWRCGLIWWIQSLYVQPPFRRQGVFRRLYDHVRTAAVSRSDTCGIRLYVEQSNDIAQQAYAGMGMHRTSYRLYEEMF